VNYSSGPFYTTPYKPAEVDGSQSSRRSYATTPNAQVSFFDPEDAKISLLSTQRHLSWDWFALVIHVVL
jgi:hypothetical protein